MKQHTLSNKVLSIVMSAVFLCSTAVTGYAVPMASVSENIVAGLDISSIAIPAAVGEIKEVYIPHDAAPDRLIIHVQEAHANYSAQKNISRIIKEITDSTSVDLVGIEGASVDAQDNISFIIRTAEQQEVRELAADTLLKSGLFTGSNAAAAISNKEITTVGTEDLALWQKDRDNFIASLDVRKKGKDLASYLQNQIEAVSRNGLSEDEKAFVDTVTAYRGGRSLLTSYAGYLSEIVGQDALAAYPNFTSLAKISQLREGINFTDITTQKDEVTQALAQIAPLQTQALEKLDADYRAGAISAFEYYGKLRELAMKNGINEAKYDSLFKYVELVELRSDLSTEGLFNEVDAVEALAADKVLASEKAQATYTVARTATLLEKFVQLRMTRRDCEYYTNNADNFSQDAILAYFRTYGSDEQVKTVTTAFADADTVFAALPQLDEFYAIALKRDEVMVANTLKHMEERGKSRAILVAGGFHTEGIKQELQNQGIAYMVIAPRVTEPTNYNKYISMLKNGRLAAAEESTITGTITGVTSLAALNAIEDNYKENSAEYQLVVGTLFSALNSLQGGITADMVTSAVAQLANDQSPLNEAQVNEILTALFGTIDAAEIAANISKRAAVSAQAVKTEIKGTMGAQITADNTVFYNIAQMRKNHDFWSLAADADDAAYRQAAINHEFGHAQTEAAQAAAIQAGAEVAAAFQNALNETSREKLVQSIQNLSADKAVAVLNEFFAKIPGLNFTVKAIDQLPEGFSRIAVAENAAASAVPVLAALTPAKVADLDILDKAANTPEGQQMMGMEGLEQSLNEKPTTVAAEVVNNVSSEPLKAGLSIIGAVSKARFTITPNDWEQISDGQITPELDAAITATSEALAKLINDIAGILTPAADQNFVLAIDPSTVDADQLKQLKNLQEQGMPIFFDFAKAKAAAATAGPETQIIHNFTAQKDVGTYRPNLSYPVVVLLLSGKTEQALALAKLPQGLVNRILTIEQASDGTLTAVAAQDAAAQVTAYFKSAIRA